MQHRGGLLAAVLASLAVALVIVFVVVGVGTIGSPGDDPAQPRGTEAPRPECTDDLRDDGDVDVCFHWDDEMSGSPVPPP